DIAPSWLDHLAADGVLVLTLIMNGVTRTIGIRRDGYHLTSTSTEVAGFVQMQGAGQHAARVFLLTDRNGKQVKLRFDYRVTDDMTQLDGGLGAQRTDVWSAVTIKHQTAFADPHLWFARFLHG